MQKRNITLVLILISLAFLRLTNCFAAEEPQGVPPLKIVYFVPSDMTPFDDRQERLGRVMRYVQDFYRKEMKRNGYGEKTFALEWDSSDQLKLYVVNGKKSQSEYGRNDWGIIRNEVYEALRKEYQMEPDREVVVIFQLLLKWEGNKAVELGPYVGGGSYLSGTAWFYDDPKLDSLLLPSKESGGYYGQPCSLGKFNTHYIGGIAHELGHAFSLPHDCELESEREILGTSLMGGGNHTFGCELRGEGKGTFLSAASAMRLSKVRAFAGNIPDAKKRVQWNMEQLEAKQITDNAFQIDGKISATPPLVGIIAYNDNQKINADYDAKTWTTTLDNEGCFHFEINELLNVPYQLRIVGVCENGATETLSIDYEVQNGKAEIFQINRLVPLNQLKTFFIRKNAKEIERIAKKYSDDQEIQQRAEHLISLLSEKKMPVAVAELSSAVQNFDISNAKFSEAKTGWGAIQRDQVPEDVFIQIGGKFFKSGLYAHAPSLYQLELDGKWKTLDIGYGLQDGHNGEICFVVIGDGKEIFRSGKITDHQERRETFDITNVKTLQLIVEPINGNTNSAWGVWISPMLRR